MQNSSSLPKLEKRLRSDGQALFRVSEMSGFTPAQFRPNSGPEYALFEVMPGRADMNIDKH